MESNISGLLKSIPRDMLDFIADGQDGTYTDEDVAECMTILQTYLKEVDKAETTEAGLEAVKVTVLKFNELNERCEHTLIETDQREDIAELIQTAFLAKAFALPDSGDVTEEWREW